LSFVRISLKTLCHLSVTNIFDRFGSIFFSYFKEISVNDRKKNGFEVVLFIVF